jgi:hypothetical protein
VATAPVQPLDAVQPVTVPAELQVSTLLLPLAIVGGAAEKVTVGAPGGLTKIWVLAALLVPPAPVHVSEYVVLALSSPVDWLPPVASVPVHPPNPVQLVAPVELHVNVDALLYATLVGAALSEAVGTASNVTVAEAGALVPPGPLHVSVYTVVALTVAGGCEPLLASVPVQPPLAWHAVALLELQVRLDVPPDATAVGFAVNVAVGTKLTVTETAVLDPPAPLQTIENEVLAVIAAVL